MTVPAPVVRVLGEEIGRAAWDKWRETGGPRCGKYMESGEEMEWEDAKHEVGAGGFKERRSWATLASAAILIVVLLFPSIKVITKKCLMWQNYTAVSEIPYRVSFGGAFQRNYEWINWKKKQLMSQPLTWCFPPVNSSILTKGNLSPIFKYNNIQV